MDMLDSPSPAEFCQWFESHLDSVQEVVKNKIEGAKNDLDSVQEVLKNKIEGAKNDLDSVQEVVKNKILGAKNDVRTFYANALESHCNEKKKILSQIELSKQNLAERIAWFEANQKKMREDELDKEMKQLKSMNDLYQNTKGILNIKLREIDEKIANLKEIRNVDSVGSIVSPKTPSKKVAPRAKDKRAQRKLNESVIMNEQKEMTPKQRKIHSAMQPNLLQLKKEGDIPAENNLSCLTCGKQFTNAATFSAHCVRHSVKGKNGVIKLRCRTAGCSFTTGKQEDLANHTRKTHTSESLFHCSLCPAGVRAAKFFTYSAKEMHERNHGDERKEQCLKATSSDGSILCGRFFTKTVGACKLRHV